MGYKNMQVKCYNYLLGPSGISSMDIWRFVSRLPLPKGSERIESTLAMEFRGREYIVLVLLMSPRYPYKYRDM